MPKDHNRIQLDLVSTLNADKILLGTAPLKYERELNSVFVDFPEMLKAGRVVSIDFYYSNYSLWMANSCLGRSGCLVKPTTM
jgi:hypothetical protein